MKKLKNEKAITLIALVATIVLMLILVAVVVKLETDGKSISAAEEAANETRDKVEETQDRTDELMNTLIDIQ